MKWNERAPKKHSGESDRKIEMGGSYLDVETEDCGL